MTGDNLRRMERALAPLYQVSDRLTMAMIAEALSVNERTFYRWLAKGRTGADYHAQAFREKVYRLRAANRQQRRLTGVSYLKVMIRLKEAEKQARIQAALKELDRSEIKVHRELIDDMHAALDRRLGRRVRRQWMARCRYPPFTRRP